LHDPEELKKGGGRERSTARERGRSAVQGENAYDVIVKTNQPEEVWASGDPSRGNKKKKRNTWGMRGSTISPRAEKRQRRNPHGKENDTIRRVENNRQVLALRNSIQGRESPEIAR